MLLRYGLARIAIYMMLYAVVWLAILVGPLAAVFGMAGILREMAVVDAVHAVGSLELGGCWRIGLNARHARGPAADSLASLRPLEVSESRRG